MMRRRLTLADLAVVVGLLYFAVTIALGATYTTSGWSWRIVAPDGWYSLLGYASAIAFAVKTWRYRRSTAPRDRQPGQSTVASWPDER
ncbi:hypothetical protein PUR49_11275 [Streptomyces sp. BE147]|uniref:hypothetical protein n=1 Tax=Streptomyces sp. BE147 TaxID=3002524 RepID=UPI002E771BDA|nr:hypothetical protein [Streptomyces sp. BE147]MEE1737077.1 hypothetical protein [Streptomyces sp. BE147]